MFPAMERRRLFTEGDTAYLALHHCGACYHACQYAPPHEFGVNVRFAESSFAVWPGPVYFRNGLMVSILVSLCLALAVGMMLAMISLDLFWGCIWVKVPFMSSCPIRSWPASAGTAFALVALGKLACYRRAGGLLALADAMKATADMRNLGGDHDGKGGGCPGADDSLARRHLTFYGLAVLRQPRRVRSTIYLLGRDAPYGYFELPVVLAQSAAGAPPNLWYAATRRAVAGFIGDGLCFHLAAVRRPA